MEPMKHYKELAEYVEFLKSKGGYSYFKPISRSYGSEVEVGDRRLVMAGSNDYLGLTHDPRVQDAAEAALRAFGSSARGTRFGAGNTELLGRLEATLAKFVGKRHALVHSTGFLSNYSAIGCLVTPRDVMLCDREDHASIFEGCKATFGKVVPFRHNDADSARSKLQYVRKKYPDADVFLITEGVFSMSGDVTILPELLDLKKEDPKLFFYLDDAHGLGVMGPGGRGTAMHFGRGDEVDLIMGTFSKAMASIGGFLAVDNEDLANYIRHKSLPLNHTSALSPANAATALACLEILEKEPERVERLWETTNYMRQGYDRIGMIMEDSRSPIIPLFIGDEEKAYYFSMELFERGVFALPAIYPAVPRGQALIRTAFMSTHTREQLDFVLNSFEELAAKHQVRRQDMDTAQTTGSGAA